MNMDSALQTFIEECQELLVAMEDALLTLESAPGDSDAINALFRAMHTIKGSAGLFGLDHIVSFTHVAESVMDRVRGGEVAVDAQLIALLLKCRDHIGTLVADLEAGRETQDAETVSAGQALSAGLKAYLGQEAAEPAADAAVAVAEPEPEPDKDWDEHGAWHISVRFGRDLLRNGYDPLTFIRYLGIIGQVVHLETVGDAIPAIGEMDPEECYLGFEIDLAGDIDKAAIESAFEFVRDDCFLFILPPHSGIEQYLELIHALPEDDVRLGEILVASGTLTREALAEGLAAQQLAGKQPSEIAAAAAVPKLGEILVQQAGVKPEVVNVALEKQRQGRDAKARESRALRVEAAKLDELINLVGELVIAEASASVVAQRNGDAVLVEANSAIGRLVESIRDSALRLRMVEIGETFTRFRRVVRDVSQELGKDIELVITGAETELDKSVVEKIGDPLMHLVRNAMDHGIEPAEVRQANGKPAQGTLRLNAYHDSGSIVIEISDDGGGLNRDRILAKAIERGLAQPGQSLPDQDIYNLIFEPGFSTAEQVTNLSGRGVGMDVVRRNIDALRGMVSLDSKLGVGTTVSIRLPLTLAIIDGFLVGVGDSAYIIPLDCVVECVEFVQPEVTTNDYINLRDQLLPYLALRDLFELGGTPPRRQSIVVIQYAGQKAGLVVDQLMGEFQTVIKPMGTMFKQLRGFSGSTILGSGDVALILDVKDLIRVAIQREEHKVNPDHGQSGAKSELTPYSEET